MTAAYSNLVQHKLFYYSGCVIWAVVCVFVRVFSSPRISTFKAVAGNTGVDSFPFSCATQNSPVDFLQPRYVAVTYCKWHTNTHTFAESCVFTVSKTPLIATYEEKEEAKEKKRECKKRTKGKRLAF